MTLFQILDCLEYLGLKNCRIGSVLSVPSKMKDLDSEFLDNYVKRELSRSLSKELENKLEINEGYGFDFDRYKYSTEIFVFTKDELKKFVQGINQNR